MNRRTFLASVAALAVAPVVKAKTESVGRITYSGNIWKFRHPTTWAYKSLESGYAPTEIRLTRAQAERIFELAAKGNFAKLKTPSYGQGGIVPKIS